MEPEAALLYQDNSILPQDTYESALLFLPGKASHQEKLPPKIHSLLNKKLLSVKMEIPPSFQHKTVLFQEKVLVKLYILLLPTPSGIKIRILSAPSGKSLIALQSFFMKRCRESNGIPLI